MCNVKVSTGEKVKIFFAQKNFNAARFYRKDKNAKKD